MLISKFRPKGARYGNAALKGCVQFVQRMQDFHNKSQRLLGSDQIVDNLEIAGKLTPHIFVEDAAQRTTADLSTELRFARDDSCVGVDVHVYSGAKARLLRGLLAARDPHSMWLPRPCPDASCLTRLPFLRGTRPTLSVGALAVPWRKADAHRLVGTGSLLSRISKTGRYGAPRARMGCLPRNQRPIPGRTWCEG